MIGRRETAPPDGVEAEIDLAAEIDRLRAELNAVENCSAPLEARLNEARHSLEVAAQFFREHGFQSRGVVPSEREHYGRLQMIGAFATLLPEQTLADMERRVRAAFEQDRRLSLSPDERDRRLADLRQQLRKVEAAQEIQFRQREARGETVTRPHVAAEIYLAVDDYLAAVAEGREGA